MTISAQLQQIYTSEVDLAIWEGLILSHSAAGTLYLANSQDGETRQGLIDGAVRTFAAIPFSAVLPTRDGEGQADLRIAICNVGLEMTRAIEKALSKPSESIRCRYTIFLEGNTAPQIDPPLELALTDVALTIEQVTATATRAQVFDAPFPRVLYTGERFPGLVRR